MLNGRMIRLFSAPLSVRSDQYGRENPQIGGIGGEKGAPRQNHDILFRRRNSCSPLVRGILTNIGLVYDSRLRVFRKLYILTITLLLLSQKSMEGPVS